MDELLDVLSPFVAEGLDRREHVFVAVGAAELSALRAQIGADAPELRWEDTREWHPHPATRLRAFHEFVTDELRGGADRIRLVGEPVWPPGPPEHVREWERYESVLNEVLGPFPVTLMCTYDAARVDPAIATNVRRTHPVVLDGEERPSEGFEEPTEFLRRWNADLAPPPRSATALPEVRNLAAARRSLLVEARRAGVGLDPAMDLCLATNEVLTNALVHASGATGVWVWTEGDRFLCQIEDRGPGIGDPVAGYRPPGDAALSGRGLWIARQFVDLLQISGGPSGTRVRLHARRA